MSADLEEYLNLFRAQKSVGAREEAPGWADVQEYSIVDSASSQQMTSFDNQATMNTPWIPADSFLVIPIQWASSNPNFPYSYGTSPIAPKMGVLSLIQGVQFSTSAGEQIVNEQYSPWYMNQLRPRLELTQPANDTIAKEGFFQPDEFPRYMNPVRNTQLGFTNRPSFGAQLAGTTPCGAGSAYNPPYYAVANAQSQFAGTPGGTTSQAASLQNLNSDVFNQNNEFRLGFGISSVTKTTSGGGFGVGASGGPSTSSGFTGTINMQINPHTFTVPTNTLAAASLKFLHCSPTTLNGTPAAGSAGNACLDVCLPAPGSSAASQASLVTPSNLNVAALNDLRVYDADWPVVQLVFSNGALQSASIIHPGSGLMYLPQSAPLISNGATAHDGVTLVPNFSAAQAAPASDLQDVLLTYAPTAGSTVAYSQDGTGYGLHSGSTSFQITVTIGPTNNTLPGNVAAANSYLNPNNPVVPIYGMGIKCPIIDQPLSYPNMMWNKGFDSRIKSFWKNTTQIQQGNPAASPPLLDVYQTNLRIRLADLHDHFRKLDMPVVNLRVVLNIYWAAPIWTGSVYYGMQLGPGIPTIAPPLMAINGSGSPSQLNGGVPQWGGQGQCKMYMKTVRFDESQSNTYRALLAKGLKLEFVHLETEVYQIITNSTSATVNQLITTSTQQAQRIWVYTLGLGNVMLNQGINNPLANGTCQVYSQTPMAIQQPWCGFLPTGRFQQITLLINQKPWRDVVFTTDEEYWEFVRRELRGDGDSWDYGSLINFDQFRDGYMLFYPFSLERSGKRFSKNENIQISIQASLQQNANNIATGTGVAPYDAFCLIEKTAKVEYFITAGSAKVDKKF